MKVKELLGQIHSSQRVRIYDKTKKTFGKPILVFDSDFANKCLDEADLDALSKVWKHALKAKVAIVKAIGKDEIEIFAKPRKLSPSKEMGMLWIIGYLNMSKEEKEALKRAGKEKEQ